MSRPATDRSHAISISLIVISLMASWLASFLLVYTAGTVIGADGKVSLITDKPLAYYLAHAIGIAAALAAGVRALSRGEWRWMTLGCRIALAVLIYAAVMWAIFTYSLDEVLSPKIVGITGPFVWVSLVVVFAGMDPSVWPAINRTATLIAAISVVLAVTELLRAPVYQQYRTASPFLLYCKDLTVFGGWTLLMAVPRRGLSRLLCAVPWATLIITAVYGLGRSWLIDAALLMGLFLWLPDHTSAGSRARRSISVLLAGAVVAVLLMTPLGDRFTQATTLFEGRLLQDSRTGQLRDFFADVAPQELILGRGPHGTWYWPSVGEYQFLDNAYLWMLFIGGLPTLGGYVAVIVWPALRSFRHKPAGTDGACTALLLLWGLMLAGLSTFILPSLEEPSFMIALMAGRCHAFLNNVRPGIEVSLP